MDRRDPASTPLPDWTDRVVDALPEAVYRGNCGACC
ncbi:hypothetical protein GZL_00707 [Streptomyces sp. 769]|nr:hypothetical protein GZL_00707 [Streptomyces sp. 769]